MNIIYFMLAFIAGMGATLQANINSRLRLSLGNPVFSSLVNFTVGGMVLVTIYIANSMITGNHILLPFASVKQTSWWMWTGGFLGALYVFTTVYTSPKIGFGSMFSLIVAGQILLAVIFDHFGFLGTHVHPVSLLRMAGVCLLSIGVYVIQTY